MITNFGFLSTGSWIIYSFTESKWNGERKCNTIIWIYMKPSWHQIELLLHLGILVLLFKPEKLKENIWRMGLPLTQRLGYSIGHVLNDLTASVWFSYLIVYFHQVMNFNNNLAGYLMLIGQVSDAMFTPFIGYESDRTRGFCGLGRRKAWHLVGRYILL